MNMTAVVLEAERCGLLVCDRCTCQKVFVHTPHGCCYCTGERICIEYNGIMTMSNPPQITAICIRRLPECRCREY